MAEEKSFRKMGGRLEMKKPKHKMTVREKKEARSGYLFICPWIIGFVCLTGGPLLFSLYASFTNYDFTSQMDFIGLENYIRMFFKDPVFWKALGNTLYYVILAVPLSCICAIFLATLLNQKVKGTGIFRMLFYLPTVLSGVAVYQLWILLLSPQSGLINSALRLIGIEGRIQTRTYDDKDGKRVYLTEVNVGQFSFLEAKKNQASSSGQPAAASYTPVTDVPF